MNTNEEYIKMLEPLDNYANLEYISRMNNGKINGSLAISLDKLISTIKKDSIEFAQRWISVEEELPPIGEMVLTKMEKRHGDTWVQHYYSTATRLENQGEWQDVNWVDHSMSFGYITHWRPVNLK